MDEDFLNRQSAPARAGRRKQTRTVLWVALIAFLLGAGLAVFLAWRAGFDFGAATLRVGRETAVEARAEGPVVPAPTAATQQNRQVLASIAQRQGGLDQRLAAMEQRLTRLDLQAQAAAGNAGRAEGMLIAFAARRAIERGAPLGYLADQLRLRFGDARPNAVATIIAASRDPVTVEELARRLDNLAPTLREAPRDEGLFSRVGRELSELFVIRHAGSPSPAAERRLERARLYLENGQVEAAIGEVRRLPNAAEAEDWISDAERNVAALRALDLLETAALLAPRELRDAEGDRIEQPSPAAPPAVTSAAPESVAEPSPDPAAAD